jgi:hypothetical protein
MATFNTAFGSLPGTNEMLGTTNTTGGGQQNTYNPQRQFRSQQTTYGQAGGGQPQQTFAQLQRQGMARPAPAAPQAQPVQQFGGSQQAQQMRQSLQQQLQAFGAAPSRFDTQAFQQIRGAQAANLGAEYQAQQKQLNEELARRGLSASSIGGGRMGDLAGQQSRALADIDAQLLQRAAETQAQDRAQLLQAGQGLAELAGSQDLSQFEANRVAQAAEFENQLRAAQFGQQQYEQGTQQALQAAQAQQSGMQFGSELGLRLGELTGQVGGMQTLAAGQQAEQRRQFDIQQALQQQLGVGNLSLEQARLAQQGSQFQQQLNQEASQFGLTLNEQQAGRLQQYGISVQELGLETQRVQNQASQFGQQLSSQNAQNLAQNNLEQQRINEAVAARGEGARQFNLEQSLQQALGMGQLTGQVATPLTTGTAVGATATGATTLAAQQQAEAIRQFNTAQTEAARQFNLEQSLRQALAQTEATGYNYIPLTTGTSVGAVGGVVSGQTLAREAQQAQQNQANLDLLLRRQLGLTELTGYTYDPTGSYISGGQTTVGARSQQTAAQSAQYQAELAAAQQRIAASQYQSDLMVQLVAALKAAGGTIR